MPDRIVRVGILTSDPVNSLTWAGEVFYRRLFNIADDFGRYDARPTILRAMLYPTKIDRVSDADVSKWLAECAEAGLVSVYQVSAKPFLEIQKFGQKIRATKSKWPSPADSCQQLPADVSKCLQPPTDVPVVVVVSDVVEEKQKHVPQAARFPDFWAAYPVKRGKKTARDKWKQKHLDAIADRLIADVQRRTKSDWQWLGGFVPHASTYLHQERWEDELGAAEQRVTPQPAAHAPANPEKRNLSPEQREANKKRLADLLGENHER